MTDLSLEETLDRAAAALTRARALLVTAGAGMGVDSGLPDFRGDEGFWRAYPPFARLGLRFVELANPRWFHRDPHLAWGFYGHRMMLYRRTIPHAGFDVLRRWGERLPEGAFVFTSNVDGQFQRTGFPEDRVVECHGTLALLQCLRGCGTGIFPSDGFEVAIDEATCRARDPLPSCPRCSGLARPNVLMFGDADWDDAHQTEQQRRLGEWLSRVVPGSPGDLVVVECGAGSAVPTVRLTSERIAAATRAPLLRLNVREPWGPDGCLGLPLSALDALTAIDARLSARRGPGARA